MSVETHPGKLLFACGALMAIAIPALAQVDVTDEIEEIQVTATRRPTSVRDVSAALTVISTEEIARAKLVTDSR